VKEFSKRAADKTLPISGQDNSAMVAYASMTERQQVRVVRSLLVSELSKHGVLTPETSLEKVHHGFNTTFRLRGPGQDVAIRVNVNSRRTLAHVRGEISWMESVAETGRVSVPVPVPLFAGSALTTGWSEELACELTIVAFQWVKGRVASDPPSLRLAYAIGRAMRNLHEIAPGLELPKGADRPIYRDVLDGLPWLMGDEPALIETLERSNAVLQRLEKVSPRQLCHFDLHFANVMRVKNGITLLDFDDSVWTWPAVDAAQTVYYTRCESDGSRLESEFWSGYGAKAIDLGVSEAEFESLVAGRQLLLANDVVQSVSAELVAIAPKYRTATVKRCQQFLETGRFDPRSASWENEA
jgi:hypothetical protein